MTNEQAKKMLKAKLECLKRETSGTDFDCNRCNCDECSLNYEQGNMGEQKEALDMAIKALEQKPCEDAISRQAVRDALSHMCSEDENGITVSRANVNSMLRLLPPVTPQPNTGRWIAVENEEMETVGYYCSECDLPMETEQRTNFCPNCGAKMESEEEE